MHEPTRRSFLAATAAAAASTLARSQHQPSSSPTRRGGKRILILGGTSFLGPAVVRPALARGHTVTLWNRGRTNPGLFPDVEQLRGQRRRPRPDHADDPAQDLTALADRKWDAVVDTNGFFTGEVEDVGRVLAGNVGQYVYISSLSVYRTLEVDATPVDEQSTLCECDDKYRQDMGKEYVYYGALKRYCEDAVVTAFGAAATLVRPGYIVGPGDTSDRFACWPARFLRGGECLAPGHPDNELQFVDVRDLGAWIVHLIEQGTMGPFNAVGFDGRISTAEFLHTGKGTLNHGCTFTWVDDDFLVENGVTAWDAMSCWTPQAKNGRASNARALTAGATFRPIAQTIRDTADWVQNERGDRKWRTGTMTADRERELLAKWHAR